MSKAALVFVLWFVAFKAEAGILVGPPPLGAFEGAPKDAHARPNTALAHPDGESPWAFAFAALDGAWEVSWRGVNSFLGCSTPRPLPLPTRPCPRS